MYPILHKERTTFQFLWEDREISSAFTTGVSLHSHTMHSEECLQVLPKHVGKIPILGKTLESKTVDYRNAFWTPPLSPKQAHGLEAEQIRNSFHLRALVSLTDHDSIQAGSCLRAAEGFDDAPISLEWTIPFGPTFFHLGVHNLPPNEANLIMDALAQFTAQPLVDRLRPLLAWLDRMPGVLLVLNHPLWDEKQIGQDDHLAQLQAFLALAGDYVHALELNGLRSWQENRDVISLSRDRNLPLVSGGDRHGCEPNAIVNLTAAENWHDFVQEVRVERKSHVTFMPQYRDSLSWRTAQVVLDILREYPQGWEGRRTWMERVYYRHPEGAQSMAQIPWKHGKPPRMFGIVTAAIWIAHCRPVLDTMRNALSSRDRHWSLQQFDVPARPSAAPEGEVGSWALFRG